jgi:hypothetical protein
MPTPTSTTGAEVGRHTKHLHYAPNKCQELANEEGRGGHPPQEQQPALLTAQRTDEQQRTLGQQQSEAQDHPEEHKRLEDKQPLDEQQRLEERQRLDDHQRLEEQKRLEEQRCLEEQKRLEEQRRLEEQQRSEEQQRLEEQQKPLVEQCRLDEQPEKTQCREAITNQNNVELLQHDSSDTETEISVTTDDTTMVQDFVLWAGQLGCSPHSSSFLRLEKIQEMLEIAVKISGAFQEYKCCNPTCGKSFIPTYCCRKVPEKHIVLCFAMIALRLLKPVSAANIMT